MRNLHSSQYFAESHVTQKHKVKHLFGIKKTTIQDLILNICNHHITYKPIHAYQCNHPGDECDPVFALSCQLHKTLRR